MLDGYLCLEYNMLNKTADKEGHSFPFRRNQLTVTLSKPPGLYQRQGGLLTVFFDVIQDCHNQQCRGQYNHEFLICAHKHTLFRKTRNGCVSRPIGCPGKHIILSWCSKVNNTKKEQMFVDI